MVVCHAAKKAGMSYCVYIDRKKENVTFTLAQLHGSFHKAYCFCLLGMVGDIINFINLAIHEIRADKRLFFF